MSVGNIFTGDAFGAVQVTNKLNLMDPPSTEMDRWFKWNDQFSRLPTIAVDHEMGRMYVLDSVAEDAPLPAAKKGRRGTYDVRIPRFGERETILNRSLIGVRETGSDNLIDIMGERDDRLQRILNRFVHTGNFLKSKLMEGKVYDGKGRLLVDFYAKQDIGGQIVLQVDLTAANLDVNDELTLAKEVAQYVLRSSNISATGWKLVCGPRANQFLRTNESVKKAMVNPLDNAFLRSDSRDGFMMSSNVNIVTLNRAHDGVGFIDEGDDPEYGVAILVPEAEDYFWVAYGPSGWEPHVNKPNEYYVITKPRDDGVSIMAESYRVPYALLVRAMIKIRIKGVPRVNDDIAQLIAESMAREAAFDAGTVPTDEDLFADEDA